MKNKIKETLKNLNNEIINKLSLQKEEDKKITMEEIDLLLWVAYNLNTIINNIEEK